MLQDLREIARKLRRDPGFTLLAVITIALGIGASTSLFGVVDTLLLRPLPYQEPERLIWVESAVSRFPQLARSPIAGGHFLEWTEKSREAEKLAAYIIDSANLTGGDQPERLSIGRVSRDYFALLGVRPALGRDFLPEEDRPGGVRVTLISHRLWQRRFNADPSVIGRQISLDEESVTIIGVMPPDFRSFEPGELWVPLALDPARERGDRPSLTLNVIARLRRGTTAEAARIELEAIAKNFNQTRPPNSPQFESGVRTVPLHERLVGGTRRMLLMMLGAVGLIFVIACANIASLLVARGLARSREYAIRAAVGASRWRLVRQMLTESITLAIAGGAVGALLSLWLTRMIVALGFAETFGAMARLTSVQIDLRAYAFTASISLLAGIVFGLIPALELSRPDLTLALKSGEHGSASRGLRARRRLLVVEVALTIVLLVGAGLLIRSFVKLLNVDPGFRSQGLLTTRFAPPFPRYNDENKRRDFIDRTTARIAGLPGVESVGVANQLPLTRPAMVGWLRVEGRAREEMTTLICQVSPEYFETMKIPLRAGRFFNERDDNKALPVAILSEALARRLFPSEDPLGKKAGVGAADENLMTVIGIVGDVRHNGIDRDPFPQIYLSSLQSLPPVFGLAIRTNLDPQQLTTSIRRAVAEADPQVPAYEILTMDERIADSIAARRFNLTILGVMAVLALVLAAVGIYGVVSQAVTQRTREIGIRMALGARREDVRRLILGESLRLVAIGAVFGVGFALALGRLIAGLLYGISPYDALTYIGVTVIVGATTVIASYLPVRRALRVNPVIALRHE